MRRFTPHLPPEQRERLFAGWRAALGQTLGET
jgi:hypothetical protein